MCCNKSLYPNDFVCAGADYPLQHNNTLTKCCVDYISKDTVYCIINA
jgi:hypothetical protein